MASWLRVAVVQFAPKLGEVHANIAKARELCRGLTPRSVDLVCFPEMIFSGYMFPDAPSIAPYLEHPQTGPTATFCAELARRLGCFVVAGLPERLSSSPSIPPASNPASNPASDPVPPDPDPALVSPPQLTGANTALLFDTTGHLTHTYHKSNLFPTDVPWAHPGTGFTALDLPHPFGRTALAICNDLNVSTDAQGGWRSIETGPYELARFCIQERVRVLVVLNAWMRPEDGGMEGVGEGEASRGGDDDDGVGVGDSNLDTGGSDLGEEDGDGMEPNWKVLNYWAMRLRPLWAGDGERTSVAGTEGDVRRQLKDEQDLVVVICNRFGRERGKIFAGSSAMFSMRRGAGKPRLLHVMGEREEGVSVWTVSLGSRTLPIA